MRLSLQHTINILVNIATHMKKILFPNCTFFRYKILLILCSFIFFDYFSLIHKWTLLLSNSAWKEIILPDIVTFILFPLKKKLTFSVPIIFFFRKAKKKIAKLFYVSFIVRSFWYCNISTVESRWYNHHGNWKIKHIIQKTYYPTYRVFIQI